MCNQTVGLIAAELERKGIPTVTLQLLRSIAEAVKPPRGLWVPFAHGYPLHKPGEPELQKNVMRRALEMAADPLLEAGALQDYIPED
ncbi:MAG: hypothetical protein P8N31_03855 [Planctomycetota bacterium]|nr:hypothetical protein [Planctomycetota bacterium]MDG2142669.1 hypothetical protein [Planctomycetota bacterium]